MNGRCENVLLVNGDRALIDVTGDLLRREGFAVVLVSRFEQALRVMRRGFQPDAILVDLTDGSELIGAFLRALADEPAWLALPVLAVSEATDSAIQISPRHRRRVLSLPADAAGLCELLTLVTSDVEGRHPDLPG